MNSTYHRAIKAIPYEVVLKLKPRFERLDISNRHLTKADIVGYVIVDDQDDFLAAEDREGQQLREWGEPPVRQSRGVFGAQEPGRVLGEEEDETSQEEEESEGESHSFEPTIETEGELLPEDPTDLDAINAYFARLNTPDSDETKSANDLSDPPPSTSPSHPLDKNLQALSPQVQSLRLNPESLRGAAESSGTFRAQVFCYRSQGQRCSTCSGSRFNGRQTSVRPGYQEIGDTYSIQTKHGVLDKDYPTSELMPLPDTIELGIPEPPPNKKKITLHTVAAKESTTEKVPVHCKCKDEWKWGLTRRCACVKAEAKCSIACHGG